jgi:hypothetical protein
VFLCPYLSERRLLLQLFLFEKRQLLIRSLVWGTYGARAKALRDGIISVTVPAVNMFIARSPREVLVPAWALLRVFEWECLLLCSCHRFIDSPADFVLSSYVGYLPVSEYKNEGTSGNKKSGVGTPQCSSEKRLLLASFAQGAPNPENFSAISIDRL